MAKRILLAAILGGLAMFAWSSAAHMSPLGMIGIQVMPREILIVDTLASGAGFREGLYVYPAEAAAAGPQRASGLLLYHPANVFAMMPQQIAAELIKEIVQAGLLAFLMLQIAGRFVSRVRFAAAAGLMVALTTNGSYAIWYGMPMSYTLTSMGIEFAGYVIAGAVIAWLLSRFEAKEPATS